MTVKDKKENAQPSKQDLAESGKSKTKEWIKDLGTALIIALVFLQLLTPTLVREHSMENTLHQNDYVFVSRRHYSWFGNGLRRGDIITFDSELTTGLGFKKILVKRIIGLPGDKISISGGNVYVNGAAPAEPYTKDGYTNSEMDEVTVPEGYIFTMGDNRQNSTDSRSPQVGFIDINRIRGKVVFRLFPVSGFGAM